MESVPNFTPSRSITFTKNDFADDETIASACFAAALLAFEGLEQRHSANQVWKWVLDVTSTCDEITQDKLEASVKKYFHEDLTELLDD